MEAAGRRVHGRVGPGLFSLFILTWAPAAELGPGEKVSTTDKVAWLSANAAAIRSINPKDQEFSDLRALREAIGSARVVLLGGTNDEGVVKARYRIVRFLHEEMGFDVLTSGLSLFDATEFDRALDQGKMPRPDLEDLNAAAFSYFTYPGRSFDRLDILDYVRGTHKTDRPLHLSGFGWTVSQYMLLEYSKRLFRFLDGIDPKLASPADRKAIQALVVLCGPRQGFTGFFPRMVPVEPQRWQKVLIPGLTATWKVYSGLGQLPGIGPNVSDIVFYRQTLANLSYFAAGMARRPMANPPAETAVVLAQVWRPKSKIIVWSSNWTIGRDWPPFKRPNGTSRGPARSTGNELARVFGRDAYAIAFSEIKNDNGVLQVLDAGAEPKLKPVDGDLESLMHAAGKPFSFVDFRSLPADHWLRAPLSARLVNGSDTFVWPDHYDGLVTVDLPVWKERK